MPNASRSAARTLWPLASRFTPMDNRWYLKSRPGMNRRLMCRPEPGRTLRQVRHRWAASRAPRATLDQPAQALGGGTDPEPHPVVPVRLLLRLLAGFLIVATTVLVRAAAPAPGGSIGGTQVFPLSNWWNLDISQAPVDTASASYLSFIGATTRLHPDFGPSPYGIPYVVVSGTQPLVQPVWTAYGDESDNAAPGRPP